MTYALTLGDDYRILSVTYGKYAPRGAAIVSELPEGDQTDYLYYGGYIYDPLPDPDPPTPAPSEGSIWDELDAAYQEGVDSV